MLPVTLLFPLPVMALSVDLAPHYMLVLRFFREKNPGTEMGSPGRFQGFNTGVVLFDLDRMRASEKYNRHALNRDGAVEKLAGKFEFRSHLGDQCLFSLLGLEHPELFKILPCGYNFQLDTSMFRRPFLDVFWDYHNCTDVPMIYHGNGGSHIPEEDEPM